MISNPETKQVAKTMESKLLESLSPLTVLTVPSTPTPNTFKAHSTSHLIYKNPETQQVVKPITRETL